MNAIEIASSISATLPHLRQGTLRFWGEWFGRPYDNCHQLVSCYASGNMVTLQFNEGETLSITEPEGLAFKDGLFSIQCAALVRWEWFYYGRPKTKENRYFEEFVNKGARVTTTTNVDWYSPQFSPSISAKAVELL